MGAALEVQTSQEMEHLEHFCFTCLVGRQSSGNVQITGSAIVKNWNTSETRMH